MFESIVQVYAHHLDSQFIHQYRAVVRAVFIYSSQRTYYYPHLKTAKHLQREMCHAQEAASDTERGVPRSQLASAPPYVLFLECHTETKGLSSSIQCISEEQSVIQPLSPENPSASQCPASLLFFLNFQVKPTCCFSPGKDSV